MTASGSPLGTKKFSLILVGKPATGKRALSKAIRGQSFNNEEYEPSPGITIDEHKIDDFSINISTLPGGPRFSNLLPSYIKSCEAILAVYDVTNQASFDALDELIKNIRTHNPTATIILVGTKADLEPKVTDDAVKQKIKSLKDLYREEPQHFRVSSAKGDNISDLTDCIKGILQRPHAAPAIAMVEQPTKTPIATFTQAIRKAMKHTREFAKQHRRALIFAACFVGACVLGGIVVAALWPIILESAIVAAVIASIANGLATAGITIGIPALTGITFAFATTLISGFGAAITALVFGKNKEKIYPAIGADSHLFNQSSTMIHARFGTSAAGQPKTPSPIIDKRSDTSADSNNASSPRELNALPKRNSEEEHSEEELKLEREILAPGALPLFNIYRISSFTMSAK